MRWAESHKVGGAFGKIVFQRWNTSGPGPTSHGHSDNMSSTTCCLHRPRHARGRSFRLVETRRTSLSDSLEARASLFLNTTCHWVAALVGTFLACVNIIRLTRKSTHVQIHASASATSHSVTSWYTARGLGFKPRSARGLCSKSRSARVAGSQILHTNVC